MPDHISLSKLASRLWRPVLAGVVGGCVSGSLLIAVLAWRDGYFHSVPPDPDEMAAVMEQVHQGRIGRVEGLFGTNMTLGLGQTPGSVDTSDDRWFWLQMDGLDRRDCRTIARDLIGQPNLTSLWIGPVGIQSVDAIAQACKAHKSISVVLGFGEML